MSQKLINTRIGLKYDTLANWTKVVEGVAYDTTFRPLKGEVIFYEFPAANQGDDPAILFKVGDGVNFLHDLPWGSAIAADVYAWAKEQSLLGGQYNSGTGWDFSQATSIQQETQDEVGGFIGNLVKIEVEPTGTPNQYEIKVSTDGGESWTSGGYITMTTETYSGDGQTINVDANNEISVIPAQLTYDSGNGLDVTTPDGVLTSSDVTPLVSYIQDQIASVPEYSISKQQTADTGYFATYVLEKDGVQAGDKINIPKDFLVKSATLETVTVADQPYAGAQVNDKYIDFVVNVKEGTSTDEHIYLPVKDLVDVYTGGNTDYIEVNVDGNNVITATLKSTMIANEIGSGTGDDLLPTVDAVRDYVQSEINNATPNIEAGDGIEVTTSGTTKTVSVKLSEDGETPASSGLDETDGLKIKVDDNRNGLNIQGNEGSGLSITQDGIAIDDTITWYLQCGGADAE